MTCSQICNRDLFKFRNRLTGSVSSLSVNPCFIFYSVALMNLYRECLPSPDLPVLGVKHCAVPRNRIANARTQEVLLSLYATSARVNSSPDFSSRSNSFSICVFLDLVTISILPLFVRVVHTHYRFPIHEPVHIIDIFY